MKKILVRHENSQYQCFQIIIFMNHGTGSWNPKKYCSIIKSNLKWHLHQPNHNLFFEDTAL